MINPELLPDNLAERKQFLQDNALTVEKGGYFKKWTPEEMIQAKDSMNDHVIDLKIDQEEFAEVKSEWSKKIKDKKAALDMLTNNIRTGGEYMPDEELILKP